MLHQAVLPDGQEEWLLGFTLAPELKPSGEEQIRAAFGVDLPLLVALTLDADRPLFGVVVGELEGGELGPPEATYVEEGQHRRVPDPAGTHPHVVGLMGADLEEGAQLPARDRTPGRQAGAAPGLDVRGPLALVRRHESEPPAALQDALHGREHLVGRGWGVGCGEPAADGLRGLVA